jgi:hypothetical protein
MGPNTYHPGENKVSPNPEPVVGMNVKFVDGLGHEKPGIINIILDKKTGRVELVYLCLTDPEHPRWISEIAHYDENEIPAKCTWSHVRKNFR